MNKQEELIGWLGKQYEHHSQNKGIREEITAAIMREIEKKIKLVGWIDTMKYLQEEYGKSINSQLVGGYALSQAYCKVLQKMRSLDMKERNSRGAI